MWDAERVEKLEVLILDVLARDAGRNPVSREEPVAVARAGAIEPQLHRGPRERRHDAGLEIDLEIEDHIERMGSQLAPHIGERAPSGCPVEEHEVIDRGVAPDERRGARLQHPTDACRARVPLERRKDGEDVHRVADRAHHHDADAIERS